MSTLANERVAWFNGKIVPEHEVRIPFRDSSWLYGDGDATTGGTSLSRRAAKFVVHPSGAGVDDQIHRIGENRGLGVHVGRVLGILAVDRSFDSLLFRRNFRGAGSEARLISEGDKTSTRFASLITLGSIGRGSSDTSLPSRSSRIRKAAIRPYGLSFAGIRCHGARFVEVSSIISSIAASYSR